MSDTVSILEPRHKAQSKAPDRPSLIFTLASEVTCLPVIVMLHGLINDETREWFPRLEVFESEQDVRAFFSDSAHAEFNPGQAVVLFECGTGVCMTHTGGGSTGRVPIPAWAAGAKWGVGINPKISDERVRTVANQVNADYIKKFADSMASLRFPWGLPRKKDSPPASLKLPGDVNDLVARLNSGVDFTEDVSPAHRQKLPPSSRISHMYVAASPFNADSDSILELMGAFRALEEASCPLVASNADVRRMLLQGVTVTGEAIRGDVAEAYLRPPSTSFSVRRLDLHLMTPREFFASESDEMPGGLSLAWWYDQTYGVNHRRWQDALSWLTGNGTLLFLVSHDWSRPYLAEMEEMANRLNQGGWPVEFLSTAQLDQLHVSDNGVQLRGKPIGTIWRQFPIFEVEGKLAEIVLAAQAGVVRLVPEFAHWGSKTWFSLFRMHEGHFRAAMSGADFAMLDQVMPDSLLVQNDGRISGKHTVGGVITLNGADDLLQLPVADRNQLVLKRTGADEQTSRSNGVLMGHNINPGVWQNWIYERLSNNQPFIVQQAEPTVVRKEPVFNTVSRTPEMFACRMLVRPWAIGGETVSAGIIGATADTKRVHGMTEMFVVPIDLG